MLNISYFKENFLGTCSINNLKPDHVTFIRHWEYTTKLKDAIFRIAVIAPESIKHKSIDHIPDNVRFFYTDNVDLDFTLIHNLFSAHKKDSDYIQIHMTSDIHPTALLSEPGIKVAIGHTGEKIQFIHTGKTIIKEFVDIGAYTVIHKASMDETIIEKGVKIGAHCNIGHNNIIRENTVIAAGVMTSGSVIIGKNCWLGTGCLIRNGISICDNVVIGIGSVVVKDIIEPGIYAGNPAKKIKDKPDNWNF